MRKAILTICGAVLLAASLAGCCMKHEWAEATCTEPKKCVKCGEIRRNKAAHEAKVQPDDLSLIIKLTGRHDY